MERNVNVDIYLTLDEKGINSTKLKAKRDAKAAFGDNKEAKNDLLYETSPWEIEELYFDKDSESISLCGEFSAFGEKIGYMSALIPLKSKTIIEIIEHRMKKLGKLKTVMEAIKD